MRILGAQVARLAARVRAVCRRDSKGKRPKAARMGHGRHLRRAFRRAYRRHGGQQLALLGDAGHVLTDVLALALSLIAVYMGKRPSNYRATYGDQRIGILPPSSTDRPRRHLALSYRDI